jgi:hypothetical protein
MSGSNFAFGFATGIFFFLLGAAFWFGWWRWPAMVPSIRWSFSGVGVFGAGAMLVSLGAVLGLPALGLVGLCLMTLGLGISVIGPRWAEPPWHRRSSPLASKQGEAPRESLVQSHVLVNGAEILRAKAWSMSDPSFTRRAWAGRRAGGTLCLHTDGLRFLPGTRSGEPAGQVVAGADVIEAGATNRDLRRALRATSPAEMVRWRRLLRVEVRSGAELVFLVRRPRRWADVIMGVARAAQT